MDLKPAPLTRYFEQRRVEMTEVLPGQRAPLRFTEPRSEHLATRRAAGLFDFSFMGCLAIEGPDSIALLHAIQTRNIRQLPVGRIRYTLLLRKNGTVLNDATVWRTGEDKYLLFVGRREDLSALVDRSRAFHVRTEERSGEISVIALQGPRSRDVLTAALTGCGDLSYYGFAEAKFAGEPCLVARLGYTGEAGYEIVVSAGRAPALWEALRRAGAAAALQECGFTAVDTLRIEAGHVLFLNELALAVTPEELGLARLVERKRRAGAAPRRLVGLLPDGPVQPGAAEEAEALVTSACRSPLFDRWIGLGFVPEACRHPGARVQIDANTRGTVARLPFYASSSRSSSRS